MNVPTKQYTLFILLSLSSCVGWIDTLAYDEQLIGPYHLVDDLGREGKKAIIYQYENGMDHDRVLPEVKAVGWNEDFIIVQQTSGQALAKVEFYIIVIQQDTGESLENCKAVLGPLNEQEYIVKRQELQIPKDVLFTWEAKNERR